MFSSHLSQGEPFLAHCYLESPVFNKVFNGDTSFKASSGWLRNFKLRHGIRKTEIKGEKLSASSENAEKFILECKNLIEFKNNDEEFIYNAGKYVPLAFFAEEIISICE